jgi:hypothetical protein
LGDELAIDIQLRPAWSALALRDVRLAGGLELEPQPMLAGGKRVWRTNLVGRAANIAVCVTQLAVLDVKRPAAGVAAMAQQYALGPPSGISASAVMWSVAG